MEKKVAKTRSSEEKNECNQEWSKKVLDKR